MLVDAALAGSSLLGASDEPRSDSLGWSEKQEASLVLAFPLDGDKQREQRRRLLLARLRYIGLHLVSETSRDNDEVFVQLTPSFEAMLDTAERIGMEKKLKRGGYQSFTRDRRDEFEDDSSHQHLFTSLERLQLVQRLVADRKDAGGCGIDLEEEVHTQVLSNVVPLHESEGLRQKLIREWCTAPFSLFPSQPLDDVRQPESNRRSAGRALEVVPAHTELPVGPRRGRCETTLVRR